GKLPTDLGYGGGRRDQGRDDARGGRGEGAQTHRSDPRQVPHRAELRGLVMDGAQALEDSQPLPARTRAGPRRRPRSWRVRLQGSEYAWAVAFVVPYAAVFLAFVLYPVAYGVWLGRNPDLYTELFSEPIYMRTVVNTVLYVVIGVNLKMFGALLLSGF